LELKDVSFSIAKEMVKFIYTGSVTPDFLEHRGIDLLQAAHKVLMLLLSNILSGLLSHFHFLICQMDKNFVQVIKLLGTDLIHCHAKLHLKGTIFPVYLFYYDELLRKGNPK
jgi:hypothetical protein